MNRKTIFVAGSVVMTAFLVAAGAGCSRSSSSTTTSTPTPGGNDGGGASDGSGVKTGRAVLLDGTNWVTLPSTGNYIPMSGFTWELWFSGEQLPTDSAIAQGIGPYPPQEILFTVADTQYCVDVNLGFGAVFAPANKLTFAVDGPGGCADRDTTPIGFAPAGGFENGQWYHVAAVRDYGAGSVALYLDGVLVASKKATTSGPINGAGFVASVGRFGDGSNDWAHFQGAIDELRVYNRPLGAAEIAQHYNRGEGSYGTVAEAGLVAGWHFDETTGTVAKDFGPGHLDGALVNSPTHVEGVAPAP